METNAVIRRVCVFCGSRLGRRDSFAAAARAVGRHLAERGIGVVYGGGGQGLMGSVADGALSAGGEVIGVIPSFMIEREHAHTGVSDMRIVTTMAERKDVMMSLSDAFIVLPGGVGTLDELFEVISLRLLGMHAKPIAILDVHAYFTQLRHLTDLGLEEQFISGALNEILIYESDPERLLERLVDAKPALHEVPARPLEDSR